MKILVMDDSISRVQKFREWLLGKNVTVAITAEEAMKHLKNQVFDLVFLDHDLGVDATTGSVMVRNWMREKSNYATKKPLVVVHTSSDSAASLMTTNLKVIGAEVVRKPFYSLSKIFIDAIIAGFAKN